MQIMHVFFPTALGMEDGRILDSQVTASSQYSAFTKAAYARLHLISTPEKQGAWAAANKKYDPNPWLQVDLLRQVHVLAIATQGRSGNPQWVTSYSLQSGNDGVMFIDYNEGQIFQGNENKGAVVKHELIPAITAKYIRVLPKTWNYWAAMRIELYGCYAV